MHAPFVPDPRLVPVPALIDGVVAEISGCITIDAVLERQMPELTWEPGQFNMLHVHGNTEIPISVSTIPQQAGRITHTIRDAGLGSKPFLTLKKGGSIGLRGPFGNAWPMEQTSGKDVVLVAGGLGLAPLRPAIHWLQQEAPPERRAYIAYGTRSPHTLLYPQNLEEWSRCDNFDVRTTVDQAPAGWMGNVGVVTDLFNRMDFRADQTIAFVCGPEIMMQKSAQALIDRGVAAESVYLSLERNMKCATGFCGHCQFGPHFICKDGPIFAYPEIKAIMEEREI